MAPRGRPTRLNPGATPTPVTDTHTTTSVTSAQLQAMIDEGVTAVLAARATTRNGDDSHTSGTGDGRLDPVVMRGWKSEFRISKSTVENQNEIKKLKAELWNLKVKGNQMVVDYNPTFPGNRHCCVTGMFPEETNKIKRPLQEKTGPPVEEPRTRERQRCSQGFCIGNCKGKTQTQTTLVTEQQKELDDALAAPENRLKIGKSNLRLSTNLKSKEPTIQVVLDALKLTPFYNAFEISVDVPKIYMQEFWVTITRHHSSLRFKLDGKSHTVNVDNFRDAQNLPQTPCRKTTALESLRLSRAQILWGIYYNKQVDYVYLLWEDLVFQVENKNSKKNNDMYYPCFTKVIVDYFMAKDQAIPRRNMMFWHYTKDDFMFTTIRVISKHKDTQEYSAILPQHLTNQAMLESEAFKTYRAYATGEKAPKSKATKKKIDSESSPKTKTS
ncbi:hypothetical protein Tco_1174977 [Tanacetum coccineum]